MPIDPSIIGQIKPVTIASPFETMETVAKTQAAQSAAEFNRAKAEEARRETRERQIGAMIVNDPQYGGDWQKIEPVLRRHAGLYYPEYKEALGKAQKEAALAIQEEAQNEREELEEGLRYLGPMIANPGLVPVLLPVVRKRLPELADAIGDETTFDPERARALQTAALTNKEQLDARAAAVEGIGKGNYSQLAGLYLKTPPEERPALRQRLHNLGVRNEILDVIETNPEALATTEEQRQQAASRAADDARALAAAEALERERQATLAQGEERLRQGRVGLGFEARRTAVSEQSERRQAAEAAAAKVELNKLPPEYANVVNRVISNPMIAANRRPALVAHANQLAASGNTEELKQVVQQWAVDTENVASRNMIIGRLQTTQALKEIKQQLQELKAAGVDTNLLRGTVEDVARKMGTSSDTRLARIGARMSDSFLQYRRSITGAAFSVPESGEYEQIAPGYKNTLPLNEALIDGLTDSMASRDREFWTRKLGQQGAELVGALPRRAAPPPPPGGGGGTTGAAPPPANVGALLQSKGPGNYKLSDGSVWQKKPDGTVVKVQ